MKVTLAEKAGWCENCDDVLTRNQIDVWGIVSSGSKVPDKHPFGQNVCITFVLCNACLKLMQDKVAAIHEV